MIPCYECILLAICKQKDGVECDILAKHLVEHIEYNQGGNISKGFKTWIQLRDVFERYDDQIFITGDSINTFYVVGPTDVKACIRSYYEKKRNTV